MKFGARLTARSHGGSEPEYINTPTIKKLKLDTAPLRKSARRKHARHVPFIQQMTTTECGAACLAMILSFYGRNTTIADIARFCPPGRDGLSALQIAQVARALKMRVRAVTVQMTDARFITLPAIIHWEFNHFLVVERWSPRFIDVVDPAIGPRRLTHEQFSAGFTGVVLMLEPGVHFERQRKQVTSSLWAYAARRSEESK